MAEIIITDDSAVFRSTLRKILEDEGHIILAEASNADEALKLLTSHKPDLLILDLLMPGKSGLDVLKEIGQTKKEQKVLVVTAVNQKSVNDEAKRLGAKAVLYKPFDSTEVAEMVKKLCR